MAVYQKALKLLYVDQLLERMKADFVLQYEPKVGLLPHAQATLWSIICLTGSLHVIVWHPGWHDRAQCTAVQQTTLRTWAATLTTSVIV